MSKKTRIASSGNFFSLIASCTIEKGDVILSIEGKIQTTPSKYSIQKNKTEHIHPYSDRSDDIESEWKYINHSCNPNSFLAIDENLIIARRNILSGEEIRFNYNTTEYKLSAPFQCKCKSENCIGEIKGFRYLSDIEKEKLMPYLASHLKQPLEICE